ncbi:hypothetical protein [Vibrio metschnikovii]|uniref:hypothetical protein n=1 Tax=Vibrio metschnikovii TaxID=28172 RepID=UPI0016461CB5|nr:hypothetical protein [Vibrio metschnikovii]MBC3621708.1 hypothetical protein [Vibrio metschnikovii]
MQLSLHTAQAFTKASYDIQQLIKQLEQERAESCELAFSTFSLPSNLGLTSSTCITIGHKGFPIGSNTGLPLHVFRMLHNVRVDVRYGAESFIDHKRVLDNLFPALSLPFGYSVLTTSAVSSHNAPYSD